MNTTLTDTSTGGEKLMCLLSRLVKCMSRARHHHGHAQHAQMHALACIQKKGPMSQRDLLEDLDVRSSSLSETLGKLERGGFITRERDERDKRNVILSITEAGTAEAEKVKDCRRKNAETAFADLSQEEKLHLAAILEKVVKTVEANCGPCEEHGHHHGRHGDSCREKEHGHHGRHHGEHHGHGHR